MAQDAAITILERSICYHGLAEAFRSPSGGAELLDETWIPLPTKDAKTEFLEAFEPSVSKSACSLYQSTHANRDQTSLFEELIRWYDHFGLQRKAKAELPDHVSVELEFMHFLTYREHLCGEDNEAVTTLRRAEREFLQNHLHPFSLSILGHSGSFAARYKVLSLELERFLCQHLEVLREE